MRKILVMGIGNPILTDDRAGIEAVEEIKRRDIPVHTEILHTVGFEVMDKVLGYDRVYVVDASKLGYDPGTITSVMVEEIKSTPVLAGTHAVTLETTLMAGYKLFPEEMPEFLQINLIEADIVNEFSEKCTPSIQKSVLQVVDRIEREVAQRAEACMS
ncbi:MAG: hydrogenase maturation protease [Desulfovibrionales bacterium]